MSASEATCEMAPQFIPDEAEWVRSHYHDVPLETLEFCGDISGKTVLNLGCGELLTDFGLLGLNVKQILGLDLDEKSPDHLDTVAKKLQQHGIQPARDYRTRIAYQCYGGEKFPFDDSQFDFVFSWSAFEHVLNVPAVLSEIHRVLRDDGRAFIQVYPWYHSFAGSHLSDYIPDPYFHLTRTSDWVRDRLRDYAAQRPDKASWVQEVMYPAYLTLNRYSANRFYRDVMAAGFRVVKATLISSDLDLSDAPPNVDLSDLMICGTKMLLEKADSPRRTPPKVHPRVSYNGQIDEIHRSLSWRITAPLRFAGGLFLRVTGRSRK